MPNRLPPIPLPYTKARTVFHRGRLVARYLDDASQLLHALATTSPSSRQLDTFASEWTTDMLPNDKATLASRALEPRWLAADVAKNACALSMRRLTALVDQNLENLRGLIRVDTFVDEETGELRSALTLRGVEGLNRFLLLVIRQAQPVRGLYYGCRFVKRIAPVIAERQSDAAINDLVSKINTACAKRLRAREAA